MTIGKIADNRSLTELYLDWGIIRVSNDSSNIERSKPGLKPPINSPEVQFTKVLRRVEEIGASAKLLDRPRREAIIAELESLLKLLKANDLQSEDERESSSNKDS
jgi:hypothetical protein